MSDIRTILAEEFTDNEGVIYATARKWLRKQYTLTGGAAMWLTGGQGAEALDEAVQTTVCHAWPLFVNGSVKNPTATIKQRINGALGVATKRVTKEGRLFRPSDRQPSAGHAEAMRGRLHRTTYDAHEGNLCDEDTGRALADEHVLAYHPRDWNTPDDGGQSYRVPENHEALTRIVKRMIPANCTNHSAEQCRSYRKIVRAIVTAGGVKSDAAKALGMPKQTLHDKCWHVADALRQVLAIGERKLKREHVAPAEHVQLRCWQSVPACLPLVAAESVPPTSAATGGPHDRYPVPTAKRWADKPPTPLAAAPLTRETVGQILARQATIRAAYDRHVATR